MGSQTLNELVGSIALKLLLNAITRPSVPFNRATYSIYYEGTQSSVLQGVGSAAAIIVLLPFSYLVNSRGEWSRSRKAKSSLHVLLVLIHYLKCAVSEDYSSVENNKPSSSNSLFKENPYFSDNPYCKALEHATVYELDRVGVEHNVGDCAARGADLFEGIAAEIISDMILGGTMAHHCKTDGPSSFILFPLVVHSLHLAVSSVGIFSIRGSLESRVMTPIEDPMTILQKGYSITIVLSVLALGLSIRWLLYTEQAPPAWFNFALCGLVGIITAYIFVWITKYYTDYKHELVRTLALSSSMDHGTNIIVGVSLGLQSTALSILDISVSIISAFWLGHTSGLVDEALRQLKLHLQRAQGRMKNQADSKRKEKIFEKGDWVFMKLHPHKQQSVALRINAKLSARCYGPYQVLECVGTVVYKLKLPVTSKVHPVFHVSLLKKAIGNYQVEETLPSGMEGDLPEVLEPAAVLATRTVCKKGETINQMLIHWKGKPTEEATWEDEVTIQSQFPQVSLGDKAEVEEGGIDRAQDKFMGPNVHLLGQESHGPKVWKDYTRRNKRESGK